MGTMIGGWATGARGEPEAGANALAEGLSAFQATGARMMLHFYLALLADTHRRAGRLDEALAAVENGLSKADASTRFYAPELYRLKGQLLSELRPKRAEGSAAALRAAVTLAHAQQAAALEQRAQACLDRLTSA